MSVKRALLTLVSPLIVASAAYAGQVDTSKENVINALLAMGYIKVSIDECDLSFSRLIQPTDKNHGYFAYTRRVKLSSVDQIAEAQIGPYEMESFFILRMNLREEYKEAYSEFSRFYIYLRRKFPETRLPYTHPSNFDANTPVIEFELETSGFDLDQFNSWVTYSNYGRSTRIEEELSFSYSSPEPLQSLLDGLIELSDAEQCEH